ncbi:unnamed protein product [Somion occarium]|uniref:Pheromone receptor n=1 Tax=Somion occarium TaxID=3059160 RepID=A0ABP1CPH3_9APHY
MSIAMPIGSILAALLVLLPLPGHWRARNVPTISIIAWLFVINVAHAVNTIAWAHNVDLKLLVWCDIVIRVELGGNVALPAACFCLCMHLERVASIRMVQITAEDKRRRMIIDLLICWGMPFVYMGLWYIVQGHRFDIVENFGCRGEDYVSVPQFCLVWLPPIFLALGTFVFAGLSFMHFFRRRASFARHLASSSGLNPSRYLRLMSMSVVEMFWSLIVVGITCWFNYRTGMRPWTNWDDVHFNFSRIDRYPTAIIPQASLKWTYFVWWTLPISTYIFVLFFAFGQDAMKEYRSWFQYLARPFRKLIPYRRTSEKSSLNDELPVYSPPPHLDTFKSDISKSENSVTTATTLTEFIDTTLAKDTQSPQDSVLSYYAHRQSHVPEYMSSPTDSDYTLRGSISSQIPLSSTIASPAPAALLTTNPPKLSSRFSDASAIV